MYRRAYKDDPTIFAWELINEPRCNSADNPDCTRIVQVTLPLRLRLGSYFRCVVRDPLHV